MYNSPIKIIYEEIARKRQVQMENDVLKVVQSYNIQVDKEELLKALKYDREQYKKGYQDGLNADKWIPCSERPPKEGEYVFASVKKDVAEHRIIISKYDMQYYWHNGYIEAWQPLPEPYKEGET